MTNPVFTTEDSFERKRIVYVLRINKVQTFLCGLNV